MSRPIPSCRNRIYMSLWCLMTCWGITACANFSSEETPQPVMTMTQPEVDLVSTSHTLADALAAELRKNAPSFSKRQPLLVTTFVHLRNLERSSELGMLFADQVASRFSQHGYAILEPRLRHELAIREEEGEFILSRDIRKLPNTQQAFGAVVGHYSVSGGIIYLTAQVIRIDDNQILASVNARVPVTGATRELLIDTRCCTPMRMVDK